MAYDSLILLGVENAVGNAVRFLPPVDVAMHTFKFYCVVRDFRVDYEATGVGEYEVTGYFKFTEAYVRSMH